MRGFTLQLDAAFRPQDRTRAHKLPCERCTACTSRCGRGLHTPRNRRRNPSTSPRKSANPNPPPGSRSRRGPEPLVIPVNPLDVIAVRRAEMLEVPMLEGVVDMEALVIGVVVPIPMIVADVLRLVDFPVWMTLRFRLPLRSLPMGGCWGNPPLVGPRYVVARLRARRFRVLSFGVSAFRMLRVDPRGPEQYPCAQKQQRLAAHLRLLGKIRSHGCGPTHDSGRIVLCLRQEFHQAFPCFAAQVYPASEPISD